MTNSSVEASWATEPSFYTAPSPPQMTPKPYQLAGVEYALARDHCLLGDEMGLGKSAQAVMIGNAIGARRTLVVCPASLRLNWEREIWMWSTIENVLTYPVLKAKDGVSTQAHYVIVSYDLLRNPGILGAIMDLRWDHLILDEAHALKDVKGNQRTKVICAPDLIPSVVGRVTMASGTILPNQPIECLAANTLVLTNRGWTPIIEVLKNDLLWDGVEWVEHQGLICQGEKQTISVAGVDATPDHVFLAEGKEERWLEARLLAQSENTLRQALATGLASLPLRASNMAPVGESSNCGCSALAGPPRMPLPRGIYGAAYTGAALAGQRRGPQPTKNTASTLIYAPARRCVVACLAAYRTYFEDVITQKPLATCHTVGGAYLSFPPGWTKDRVDETFYPTSCHSPATIMRLCKLIASMSTEAMSRAIYDLLKGGTERSNHSRPSTRKSENLKPVYDLVNAGPRRRFTILSDRGPLIAHNCYNAVRLLNWDAIDRASLQDFRENYYALGGGMVRSPVYDPKIGAMVSKVHWSEEVRNVPTNLADLQFRMRKNIMVRRLKQDVLKDLPTAQWRPFPLVMTAGIKTALAHPGWKMAEKLYDMDALDTGVPIDGQIATARRLLGEAKAPAVAEYIEEMLREGATKLLVCAWHSSVLEILKKRLQKHGLVYMDGATSAGARQRAVDSFQQNPDIKIILGQMQVIGTGWTLTVAQDCVLAEPDWVPGNNDQMLARIHRIGQVGAYVTGHVPVVPGTLDERILGTAVGKSRNIFVALDKRD